MAIRRATAADAGRIAEIHVQSYDESYRGIAPPEIFEGLTVERRRGQWERFFSTAGDTTSAHVAELGNETVGFCSGLAADGEIGWIKTLYVLRRAQRTGIGQALMAAVLADLIPLGSRTLRLDVAEGNERAEAFYRALGGIPVSRQVDPGPIWKSVTLTYEWTDLATLARVLGRD
ncbi:GNAT family N-acetyltransferase [Phreatobacter sp.]|uniref:GNAT family N-acetyltransferase n=1 Tax=Phreatobacter sp. TaxID=1966341 RepID=UPI003F718646